MAMLTAKTKVVIGDLEVKNLTSVPAFNETKSTIEVTTLENEARVYIAGLIKQLLYVVIHIANSFNSWKLLTHNGEDNHERSLEIGTCNDQSKDVHSSEWKWGASQ